MTGTLVEVGEYNGAPMLHLLAHEEDKKPTKLGVKKAEKFIEKMEDVVNFIENGATDEDQIDLADAGAKFPMKINGAQARVFLNRITDIQAWLAEEAAKGQRERPAVVPTGKFTDIKVNKLNDPTGSLRGFATIQIAGVFTVAGLRVIEGKNGLFVAMPSRQKKDGTYEDIAFPVSKESREELQSLVLTAFAQAA